MKTASFLAISALMIFAPFWPLFAEGICEPRECGEKITRTDGPSSPPLEEKEAKADAKKRARLAEKARKKTEKEAGKKAKEEAMLKAREDSMAKKAERARLEEEFEQKRLAEAQRKEKLYKKIDEIERERNAGYLQKKDMRDKTPISEERGLFETVPEDVAELIGKGGEYYNNKDYDKAREYYDKARFLAAEKKGKGKRR